jgi:hypothetical protein
MRNSPTARLRFVLRVNAVSSLIAGIVGLAAAPWVSGRLGIDHVLLTRLISVGLIVFAIEVFLLARACEDRLLSGTALVSASDFVWVVGTVVVLATGVLSATGTVVAVILGLAVADFGAAQLWFRRQSLGRERTATLAV